MIGYSEATKKILAWQYHGGAITHHGRTQVDCDSIILRLMLSKMHQQAAIGGTWPH